MNVRNSLFALAYLFAFAGCTSIMSMPSAPDTSPILEIVPGSTGELTLTPNTLGAETIRFDVVNYSDDNVIIRDFRMAIGHEDASPVGITVGIRLVDGETGESVDTDAFEVSAHSARSLAVVTDVGMYGSDRLLVTLGDHAVLIRSAEIAAFGTPPGTLVPGDRIANNFALARVVHVLPEEMAPPPSGTTALVADFVPMSGILHPEEYSELGVLTLTSYGGSSVFRGMEISGANLGLFRSIVLADEDGHFVSAMTAPVSACSCGTIRMLEPVTIGESAHQIYTVMGLLSSDSDRGDITFSPESSGFAAESADDQPFALIFSSHGESRFRVWNTHPVISTRELSTHTLVNGIEQELYSIQVSSAVPGRSLHVGSLTFRIVGNTSSGLTSAGSLSDIYVRLGTTSLSPTQYRMVRTSTDEEIHPPMLDASGSIAVHGDTLDTLFSEQITVVFTDADGLLISGSGSVLTLVATPSGFATGDSLTARFGDYIFSTSVFSWGNMTANGRITIEAGDPGLVDPIVWTADSGTGGIYTGAWMITDLSRFGILTVR